MCGTLRLVRLEQLEILPIYTSGVRMTRQITDFDSACGVKTTRIAN